MGFVTFFATGIDDTIVYAGSYLRDKRKDHKKLISLGILTGTFIALGIAIFAGSILATIPFKHLIGGGVLITLGIVSFAHRPGTWHKKKVHFFRMEKIIKKTRSPHIENFRFFGLGIILFFSTGIDDLIAYSNLIMIEGVWMPICLGVVIGTFAALLIAHFLSHKLDKIPHPERLGGTMIIIMGVLLALKIL